MDVSSGMDDVLDWASEGSTANNHRCFRQSRQRKRKYRAFRQAREPSIWRCWEHQRHRYNRHVGFALLSQQQVPISHDPSACFVLSRLCQNLAAGLLEKYQRIASQSKLLSGNLRQSDTLHVWTFEELGHNIPFEPGSPNPDPKESQNSRAALQT